MKTRQITPQLRFPEFEGDWEVKKLKEFTTINPRSEELPDSFIYIDLESVDSGVLSKEERILKKDSPSRAQRLLHKNDILYQTVRPYQKNNYFFNRLEKDYVASTGYAQIRTKNNPLFVYQYIHSSYFVNKVLLRCTGTSYPAINSSDLSKIKVAFPQPKEQQKIATFLTAIDSRLQSLEKKKSLLEDYKKGVMQQIFKQALRLKDAEGNEFPEWEFKKGNLLFKSVSDKDHNSDLPILAITQDQGAIPRDQINYNIGVTEKSVSSYKVVQIGDFIISLRSFQGGIEYSNYHGICSPAYIILRLIKEMDRDFYKYYLKTPSYIGELVSKLEGIRDGKMVSYKYFSEIKLPYPSLEEQTKIANFLSAIDKKIELVNEQIEKTKTYKKGLLQQMFV
ncbi:MAG: restriction endonuclease subunit S [Aequorivita sp.]